MPELTDKQSAVVELLVAAARRRQPMPSYREIAAALHVDVRGAYQHIEALERKGVVVRVADGKGPTARRSLALAPAYSPPFGLPVVGRVAAGLPILAEANLDGHVDVGADLAGAIDDESFLLKVKGDSMIDRHIHDGDLVLVRPAHRLEHGEVGVVAVDGEATVKEVHAERDRVVLKSHNRAKAYPDQVYGPERQVRVIGRVVLAFRYIR